MKALFILLITLFSCNFQPARKNYSTPLPPYLSHINAFDQYAQMHGIPPAPSQGLGSGFRGGGLTENLNGGKQAPEGFSHCNFDHGRPYRIYHDRMGTMDLCPHRDRASLFIIRSSFDQNTNRICVIPTLRDQSGASAPVAYPRCEYLIAEQYVYLDFNFNNAPNGAMVMPENMVLDYTECIRATGSDKELICNRFESLRGYLDFNFSRENQ